jgi:lipid-A-disaccharide synthase
MSCVLFFIDAEYSHIIADEANPVYSSAGRWSSVSAGANVTEACETAALHISYKTEKINISGGYAARFTFDKFLDHKIEFLEVKKRKVSKVVLIDYPGFNLSIAKKLKALKSGLKLELIYYITPQVWAWGKGRVNKIRELFIKVLVVFPFEEKFFKEKNVSAEFVGHPLIQEINGYDFISRNLLDKKFDLDPAKEILLILPGSRKQEVKSIFPEAIKASIKLAYELDMQIIVACSSNLDEKKFYELTDQKNFKVIKYQTYDLVKHAKFGIVKSGTSTLEAGLMELPMVIVYKTSWLTYAIGRSLVKIKNIGMANIVLDEQVVPELIQNDANAENIYDAAKIILSDEDMLNNIKLRLSRIKKVLGDKDASKNAAKIIYSLIVKNSNE